jgi:hypothetical protein
MKPLHRADLVVNKEYLYRNYKSYDGLGYNLKTKKRTKSKSPSNKPKEMINKYVSPFIQHSREKALERAKEKKLLQERRVRKAWDDDFTKDSIKYFDGGGKADKSLLFKREPRIPPAEKKPIGSDQITRMTRRRNKVPSLSFTASSPLGEDDIPMMPSRMEMRSEMRQEEVSNYSPHIDSSRHLHSQPPSQTERNATPHAPPPLSAQRGSGPVSSPVVKASVPHSSSPYSAAASLARSPHKELRTAGVQASPFPAEQLFPSPRDRYSEEEVPYHPAKAPVVQMRLEQEVVRVKTRGTSPFSSRDFESWFSDSLAAASVSATPPPSVTIAAADPWATPRPAPHSRSHQTPRDPRGGNSVTEIEAATIRILESQTKAQEVNGDMIGKFTTLVAELGKIITQREQPPPVDPPHPSARHTRGKRRGVEDPPLSVQRLPRSVRAVETVPSPTPSGARFKSSARGAGVGPPKRTARVHREEVLDHILQRLQVPSPSSSSVSLSRQLMERQESAITESLHAPRVDSASHPSLPQSAPPPERGAVEERESRPHPHRSDGERKVPSSFTLPEVSNTFEVSADIMTLAEVGSGWLMPDGREEKRTRQLSSSSQPVASGANGLVAVRAHAPLKQDLAEYRKEFRRFALSLSIGPSLLSLATGAST